MSKDNSSKSWRPATQLVRGGTVRSPFEETSEAIFLTSGYVYPSADEAELAFKGDKQRYVYSRYANPTLSMFEERLALLEGTEYCVATASGMSAVFAALASQLKAGDRVVASKALFGSCLYIVADQLPKFGIETELVDGTVVGPGETFSLDRATGPRTAANGYVEAGVIDNGQPARGIAGGVSQVSTTLFNAAYFAGMTDVEHRAHSFYISRYPPGREATIADGAIDMRFRNDTPTAVLIETDWTPSSVTVRLLGTKYFEVESLTGPRTNPTSPNTVNVPAGEPCNASGGAPGFTITDTRRLTDIRTGEVRTEPTTTTRYNPSPRVVCG